MRVWGSFRTPIKYTVTISAKYINCTAKYPLHNVWLYSAVYIVRFILFMLSRRCLCLFLSPHANKIIRFCFSPSPFYAPTADLMAKYTPPSLTFPIFFALTAVSLSTPFVSFSLRSEGTFNTKDRNFCLTYILTVAARRVSDFVVKLFIELWFIYKADRTPA